MNIRLLGPPLAATVTVNGRSYSGAPGDVYGIVDADADVLGANGCAAAAKIGAALSRPIRLSPSRPFSINGR
ncbi:MAG TPA: hypothetical protein VEH77_02220 [Roseiarcus sp.]|nr:hypothetical protein [Roseiarcus sp.]